MKPAALADLLRDCLSSGVPAPLAEAYADDAVLDISLPGGRRKLSGPDAIVAALGACFAGPGHLVDWTPAVHPEGIAVWLERVGDDGEAIRQRHYLPSVRPSPRAAGQATGSTGSCCVTGAP